MRISTAYQLILSLFAFLLQCLSTVHAEDNIFCGSDEFVRMVIDIRTDSAPTETSWRVDSISGSGRNSTEPYLSDPITEPNTFNSTSICLEISECVKFTIFDSGGNGLNEEEGGFFEVTWFGEVVFEGSTFESSLESRIIGNFCVQEPSLSPRPSSEPSLSLHPSSQPSISHEPSANPSLSSHPTLTPTETEVIEFPPLDQVGLRKFPLDEQQRSAIDRTEEEETVKHQEQFLPDCTLGTVGCLLHPKTTFVQQPKPEWFGNLHYKPPECSPPLGRRRRCDLNIPTSRETAYPTALKSKSLEFLDNPDDIIELWPTATKALVVGDMNGDSLDDIVLCAGDADDMRLFINNGGIFDSPSIDIGESCENVNDIALGDLNEDEALDIVIARGGRGDRSSNRLCINDRNNGFNCSHLFAVGVDTKSVAIGDVDKDGHLDLFFGNNGSPNILWLHDGDLNFQAIPLEEGSSSTYSVALGDIDNNGEIDFIIGNISGKNEVILNQGNREFAIDSPLILPKSDVSTRSIILGDVDGDEQVDIVFGADKSNNILLLNKGENRFDTVNLPGVSEVTHKLIFGDLDGDGLVDILESNGAGNNRALINRGVEEMQQIFPDALDIPYRSALGDTLAVINAREDGPVSVVIGNALMLSNVGEDFTTIDFPNESNRAAVIGVGDFDKNNFTDIIVGSDNGQVQLLSNPGDGTYITYNLATFLEAVKAVVVGDVDGNSYSDAVVAVDDRIQIFFNNGDEGFSFTSVELANINMNPTALSLAYVDNDRLLDIIIGYDDESAPNQVHFNTRNGTFVVKDLPGSGNATQSIAACDLDGDTQMDLVFGNGGEINKALLNKGNRTFTTIDLPGGAQTTAVVRVADMNGDNQTDIIIGNIGTFNQILFNEGDGIAYNFTDLDGGSKDTQDLSLGDFNSDGWIDIVVANSDDVNQILLNNGLGDFTAQSFVVDQIQNTRATIISDFDNDGAVDILFGHEDDPTQINLYNPAGKSCPEGGARIHSGSWCFKCLAYMGRQVFFSQQVSVCVECLTDSMQEDDNTEQCSPSACSNNKERPLGSDECNQCAFGTFYDTSVIRDITDMSTWESPRCTECEPGTYSNESTPIAVDKCTDCPTGKYQTESGSAICLDCAPGNYTNNQRQVECSPCNPGSSQELPGQDFCPPCKSGLYQPESGQAQCLLCEAGGFCNATDTCGGGFTPCPRGTYNEKEGQSNESACTKCPAGTFSTVLGSANQANCLPCPSGTFSNKDGQTECILCPPGNYQPNEHQTFCLPCAEGTYARNPGLIECTKCPFRTSSVPKSATCMICDKGFVFLSDEENVDPEALFQKPDDYCKDCPPHAECQINSTLDTITLPSNYWRDSPDTQTVYVCNNNACGGSPSPNRRSLQSQSALYCIDGHAGPLCQVCTDDSYHFSTSSGMCEKCPSLGRIAIPFSIFIAVILGLFLFHHYIGSQLQDFARLVQKVNQVIAKISLQAKFKILISFYQIINTLEDVYGLELNEKFKSWFDFLQFFNFGILQMTMIPGQCIGSMQTRLVLSSLWPYIMVIVVCGGILFHQIVIRGKTMQELKQDSGLRKTIWMKFVSVSIIIFYIVLPSVAMSIFDALKCESFDTNDEERRTTSYLIADWSITCGEGSREHQELLRIFWTFFFLWIILVPLVFLGLLLHIRGSVRSRAITPLAEACSFLWRDYRESTFFWEIIDFARKIFLTGIIMFIDTQEGSTKVLRLIIAAVVSAFYLGILSYARPYKRNDDLSLAFISGLLMICCFVFGTMIQLCDDGIEACENIVGGSLDSYKASVLAVLVTVAMLIITVLFIVILGYNAIVTPTVMLKDTDQNPNMDIPKTCKYHLFVSHVWSTGQDKTHSMVQKLQLMIPGIQIWLDVNNMKEVGELEESVSECAVFVLFYTNGYFDSYNCRREVNAAKSTGRPTIVLYEDYSDIKAMRRECKANYGTDFKEVWDYLRKDRENSGLILWLGKSPLPYAIESVKIVCQRILEHLPHYNIEKYRQSLEKGLTIANELHKVTINTKVTLYYCMENTGAFELSEEIRDATKKKENIEIVEADQIVNGGITTSMPSRGVLLLYLKRGIFSDERKMMQVKAECALDSGISLLLIQEKDPEKDGVEFDSIFGQTPAALTKCHIYNELALPLHSYPAYRVISLRQALLKLGGEEKGSKRSCKSMMNSCSRYWKTGSA